MEAQRMCSYLINQTSFCFLRSTILKQIYNLKFGSVTGFISRYKRIFCAKWTFCVILWWIKINLKGLLNYICECVGVCTYICVKKKLFELCSFHSLFSPKASPLSTRIRYTFYSKRTPPPSPPKIVGAEIVKNNTTEKANGHNFLTRRTNIFA